MEKFSNKKVREVSGFNSRQVSYLSEKGIVIPDVEDSSGRGTRRYYSRRNIFELFLVRALRDSGFEFPQVAIILRVVRSFYDELGKLLKTDHPEDVASQLHLLDGRFGFLSDRTGSAKSSVFEVLEDGTPGLVNRAATDLLERPEVHVIIDLSLLFAKARRA